MDQVPSRTVRNLSRQWVGHLAHFRRHRNDEHREALFDEAIRFAGLHLESELEHSPFWSEAPLGLRGALLLFLIDRGLVVRSIRESRASFEVVDQAEAWVLSHFALSAYLVPTIDMLSALHRVRSRGSLLSC
jgi:hypothetical protein